MSLSWFEAAFDALPDPHTGNAKRHDLLELLVIALTAAVCGSESCSDFADFAVDREGLFGAFLRLKNGVPSHDTFSRTLRRSFDDAAHGNPLAVVTAFASSTRFVISLLRRCRDPGWPLDHRHHRRRAPSRCCCRNAPVSA